MVLNRVLNEWYEFAIFIQYYKYSCLNHFDCFTAPHNSANLNISRGDPPGKKTTTLVSIKSKLHMFLLPKKSNKPNGLSNIV